MQATLIGWLRGANNTLSHPQTNLHDSPPRQPHSVGTFTITPNTDTFPRNRVVIVDSHRGPRRLAGHNTGSRAPLSDTRLQPDYRSNDTALNAQSHPPPPSSDFTFSDTELRTQGLWGALSQESALGSMASRRNHTTGLLSPTLLASCALPTEDRWMNDDRREPGIGPDTLNADLSNTASTSEPSQSTVQNAQPALISPFGAMNSTAHPAHDNALTAWGELSLQPDIPRRNAADSSGAFGLPSRQGLLPSPNPWFMGAPASTLFAGNNSPGPGVPPVDTLAQSLSPSSKLFHPHGQHKTPERPRHCVICCEDAQVDLIQPCSQCDSHYCTGCIKDLFDGTLKDMSMMPMKCCTMIQLAVVLPYITKEQANEYRWRFEEWISTARTYCPVPLCSTFIPERFLLPAPNPEPKLWDILKPRLPSIMQILVGSPDAQYFRTPNSPKENGLAEFHKLVRRPVFLDMVQRKLAKYTELRFFMADLNLVFYNARQLQAMYRKVGESGDRLRNLLFKELNDLKVHVPPGTVKSHPNACFACPKCFIAICVDCRQVAHPTKQCDTSAHDHEVALLKTFGYRQCPKCAHAVKKMYGCRHIQCRCGAHWCYYCRRPIDDCDADGCDADDDIVSDYEDDDFYGMDESDEESIPEGVGANQIQPPNHTTRNTSTDSQDPETSNQSNQQPVGTDRSRVGLTAHVEGSQPVKPATALADAQTLDADAGGARRWEGRADFGDEPNDPSNTDTAWSCNHYFRTHEIKAAKVEAGYPLNLECNRCFSEIVAKKMEPKDRPDNKYKKLIGSDRGRDQQPTTAWECEDCGLVVCKDCKTYFILQKGAEEKQEKKRSSRRGDT